MYDVFFLSYDEPHAERYWKALRDLHPIARRVNGVAGIQAAHVECARLSRTSHFFVVDADNEVIDPKVFSYRVPDWDRAYVHLWYAKNPVNSLVYGWGAIKLFPKKLFDYVKEPRLDMTTSFTLKIIPEVASITHFNVSEYETWRSAFRECVKLSQAVDNAEAAERLSTWCEVASGPHAEWCLRGAREGRAYGEAHRGDAEALMLINDYGWLSERFSALK